MLERITSATEAVVSVMGWRTVCGRRPVRSSCGNEWLITSQTFLSARTLLWLACALCFGHEVSVRGAVLNAIGYIVWLWPTINIAVLREREWLPRSGASIGVCAGCKRDPFYPITWVADFWCATRYGAERSMVRASIQGSRGLLYWARQLLLVLRAWCCRRHVLQSVQIVESSGVVRIGYGSLG